MSPKKKGKGQTAVKKAKKKKLDEKKIENEIKKKLEKDKKKIKALFEKECNACINSTSASIYLGYELNNHKKMVKKIGKKWSYYFPKNFPYIHERKAQRCMRVANKVDLDKTPILSLLSMNLLEEMIQRIEKENITITEVFRKYEIDIESKEISDDVESNSDFQNNAKKIIDQLRNTTSWLEIANGEKLPSSFQEKEIKKQQSKCRRDKKKKLSRQGKIDSRELASSMNKGTTKLLRNLSFLTDKTEKIVYADEKILSIDIEEIKLLLERLKIFLSMHKSSRLKFKIEADDDE